MRKPLLATLLIMFYTVFAFAVRAADSEVVPDRPVLVTVYEWSPYSGRDLKGHGLATKIAAEALRDAGVEVEYAFVPWVRAMEVTRRGGYDVIPGMWYTDERNKDFAFSKAVLSNDLVAVALTDDPVAYSGIDSLKNRRVALVRGYTYPDALLGQANATVERGVSLGANLKKLIFRRVNVVIGDRIASEWLANRMFGDAARFIRYESKPMVSRGLYVGVSRKSDLSDFLVRALNKKIIRWQEDGTMKALIREYSRNAHQGAPLEQENIPRIEKLHGGSDRKGGRLK